MLSDEKLGGAMVAERIWTGHPLLLRLWCLLFGHEPGDERDWVGRPVQCERCGDYDAEMGRRAYERFCGRAAIADWNAEALRRRDAADVERPGSGRRVMAARGGSGVHNGAEPGTPVPRIAYARRALR